ncbi:MAG: DUF1634 domain-containing protein [Acidimicrobiia bacterium]
MKGDGPPDVDGSAGTRRVVHRLLRGGLVVAVALMAGGLVLKLAGGDHHDGTVTPFGLADAPSLGDALMGLGIVVLGLTPALRVVALAGLWARQRDWRFVGVAGAVAVTLATAALLGGG